MRIQTWRKRMDSKQVYVCPSGSGIVNTYMLNIDDDGCQCLVCTGQTDLYAQIQSHRESCDLAMLLRNIDPNSLNNMVSSFSVDDLVNSGIVDYAAMPTTLGGMFNLVQKGENLFNGLPEEVRKEFNYSVKNFVSKFGTPEFNDVMSKYMSPQTQTETTGDNIPNEPKEPIQGKNEPKSKGDE